MNYEKRCGGVVKVMNEVDRDPECQPWKFLG